MDENRSAVYDEPDLELTTIFFFNWNNSQENSNFNTIYDTSGYS